MRVNPFYLLLALYLISNFFSVIKGVNDGGMKLEGDFFSLKPDSLYFSFFVQCLFLLIIFSSYNIFYRLSLRKTSIFVTDKIAYFVIFLQLFFMAFNIKEGVNVAGAGTTVSGGSAINYIFVIFQPDLIFTILSVFFRSNKLFIINVLIFLVSMFLRGWMGGVFIIFFIVLARYYPIKLSIINSIKLLAAFCILIALLPFILYAKWSMRSGDSLLDFFNMVPKILSIVDYGYVLDYLLNRFQHVGHIALIYENALKLHQDFNNSKFDSFWLDGLPQFIFLKIFGFDLHRLNSYMVEFFFGIPNATWNTSPGISGWFILLNERSLTVICYLLFFFFAPLYFFARYAGAQFFLIFNCFTVLYLFHGWFGAYFNFMFYGFILVTLLKARFFNARF